MHVRRGDLRQAVKALRQLVDRDQSPGVWVRLGVELARCGRLDDAADALKRGAFMHRRAGSRRRADVVSALVDQLRSGDIPFAA